MSFKCPGQTSRVLTAKLIPCPSCGKQVEIFSDENSVRCPSCRNIVAQEPSSTCRTWCNGCEGVPQTRDASSSER